MPTREQLFHVLQFFFSCTVNCTEYVDKLVDTYLLGYSLINRFRAGMLDMRDVADGGMTCVDITNLVKHISKHLFLFGTGPFWLVFHVMKSDPWHDWRTIFAFQLVFPILALLCNRRNRSVDLFMPFILYGATFIVPDACVVYGIVGVFYETVRGDSSRALCQIGQIVLVYVCLSYRSFLFAETCEYVGGDVRVCTPNCAEPLGVRTACIWCFIISLTVIMFDGGSRYGFNARLIEILRARERVVMWSLDAQNKKDILDAQNRTAAQKRDDRMVERKKTKAADAKASYYASVAERSIVAAVVIGLIARVVGDESLSSAEKSDLMPAIYSLAHLLNVRFVVVIMMLLKTPCTDIEFNSDVVPVHVYLLVGLEFFNVFVGSFSLRVPVDQREIPVVVGVLCQQVPVLRRVRRVVNHRRVEDDEDEDEDDGDD
jgi:hypothetical protein